MKTDDTLPPDWHGLPRNLDVNEFPDIRDLVVPYCGKDFFDRKTVGHIKLAYLRGQHGMAALRADLEAVAKSLDHCRNVLAEHDRSPGPDLDAFMFGALKLAREALARPGVRAALKRAEDA